MWLLFIINYPLSIDYRAKSIFISVKLEQLTIFIWEKCKKGTPQYKGHFLTFQDVLCPAKRSPQKKPPYRSDSVRRLCNIEYTEGASSVATFNF
jgi:hypothetical protein